MFTEFRSETDLITMNADPKLEALKKQFSNVPVALGKKTGAQSSHYELDNDKTNIDIGVKDLDCYELRCVSY